MNFGSVNAIIFMLAIYFNLFDIVFVIHDIYHVIFSHVCHFHRAFGSDECGIGCRPHLGRISSFLCFVFPCKNIIERHNDVNNKEIEAFDPFETINIKL